MATGWSLLLRDWLESTRWCAIAVGFPRGWSSTVLSHLGNTCSNIARVELEFNGRDNFHSGMLAVVYSSKFLLYYTICELYNITSQLISNVCASELYGRTINIPDNKLTMELSVPAISFRSFHYESQYWQLNRQDTEWERRGRWMSSDPIQTTLSSWMYTPTEFCKLSDGEIEWHRSINLHIFDVVCKWLMQSLNNMISNAPAAMWRFLRGWLNERMNPTGLQSLKCRNLVYYSKGGKPFADPLWTVHFCLLLCTFRYYVLSFYGECIYHV